MRLDAEQHVFEIVERVDAVGFAGRDERVKTRDVLAGFIVADEKEVLATERDDAQRSLRAVVVEWILRLFDKARQRVPLIERVADGDADRALRRMHVEIVVEPALNLIEDRAAA